MKECFTLAAAAEVVLALLTLMSLWLWPSQVFPPVM